MEQGECTKLAELIGWHYDGKKDGYGDPHTFSKNGWGLITLRFPEGRYCTKADRDKIQIDGTDPNHKSEYRHWIEKRPEIKVSMSRPVESVASEIKRRFIPAWIEAVSKFKQADEHHCQHEQEELRRKNQVREVLPALDEKLSFWDYPEPGVRLDAEVKLGSNFRHTEAGYDSLPSLKINLDLPEDLGLKVLAMLAEHIKPIPREERKVQ